jgi:hypothetical protein
MTNHPHLTEQLMAERERELVAAAAHNRLVRVLPASRRPLRVGLAAALAGRRASATTRRETMRRWPSWRAS